jgi:hypothetical protein
MMAEPSVASLYNDLQAALGRIDALEGQVDELRKGMALKDERITKLECEIKKNDEAFSEMQKVRAECSTESEVPAEATAAVERHDRQLRADNSIMTGIPEIALVLLSCLRLSSSQYKHLRVNCSTTCISQSTILPVDTSSLCPGAAQ